MALRDKGLQMYGLGSGTPVHLGEQPATPMAQEMLGATATVSTDGASNNDCVIMIHYEGTMDAAQQAPRYYLPVLGWTAIHPRPSNHLRYYSRRRLWTKMLRESPVPPLETLLGRAHLTTSSPHHQHLSSPEEGTAKACPIGSYLPEERELHHVDSFDDSAINQLMTTAPSTRTSPTNYAV